VVRVAVGHEAQNERVDRIDVVAERSREPDPVDMVDPVALAEQHAARVERCLRELDLPDVVLGHRQQRLAVGENVRERPAVRDDPGRRMRLTSCWDDPLVGRPGAGTFGTTATRGLYAKCFAATPRASGGFTVYRPRHWTLNATDLYYGDQFGAAANMFGYEVDGLGYTVRDGLPYATGEDGVEPADVDIVAMNVATLMEEDHGHPGARLFAGDAEARFVARVVHGDESAETIDRVSRGSGMMVVYRRGTGEVFNASSCEWVNGLRVGDPFAEQITHNVLRRYLRAEMRASGSVSTDGLDAPLQSGAPGATVRSTRADRRPGRPSRRR